MRKFLEEKAELSKRQSEMYIGYFVNYKETVCEDSNNTNYEEDGCISLDFVRDTKNYSYIYKIGVLSMFDANKCDFGEFHIGIQAHKDSDPVYMGKINFKDGENMDIETTIKRIAYSMLECWR